MAWNVPRTQLADGAPVRELFVDGDAIIFTNHAAPMRRGVVSGLIRSAGAACANDPGFHSWSDPS